MAAKPVDLMPNRSAAEKCTLAIGVEPAMGVEWAKMLLARWVAEMDIDLVEVHPQHRAAEMGILGMPW